MEVTNILLEEHYELSNAEKLHVIKCWLGREGLHLIQLITVTEHEKSQPVKGQ